MGPIFHFGTNDRWYKWDVTELLIVSEQKFTLIHNLEEGVQPVFRQPRIHTGQYLDKYCFNQSESRKNINNPK